MSGDVDLLMLVGDRSRILVPLPGWPLGKTSRTERKQAGIMGGRYATVKLKCNIESHLRVFLC